MNETCISAIYQIYILSFTNFCLNLVTLMSITYSDTLFRLLDFLRTRFSSIIGGLKLKGQFDRSINVLGDVCATIHLFIHQLLFRKITKQSRPHNRKRKSYCALSLNPRKQLFARLVMQLMVKVHKTEDIVKKP